MASTSQQSGTRRVPAAEARIEPLYPATRLRRAVIEEAGQLRQALLQEAEQARREAQAAREQAEQIRREAREEGRAEGRREVLAELRPLVEALGQELSRLGGELAEQITRIALSCAGHIVRAELRANPQQICTIVRDALERARFCQQVTIIVHPQHAALLKQAACSADLPPNRVTLRTDERCAPGDVRIETERGLIDASLEVQLARMEAALLEEAKAQG